MDALDRRLLDAVFFLIFLARDERVVFAGFVGTGEPFLTQSLGYAALGAGCSVRLIRSDDFSRTLAQTILVSSSSVATAGSAPSSPATPSMSGWGSSLIPLGNSALDRLANAGHQMTIGGTSYRERLSPHRREMLTL